MSHSVARRAVLVGVGAGGAVVHLYTYLLLSLLIGPRPTGSELSGSQWSEIAAIALTAIRGIVCVSALFGAITVITLLAIAQGLQGASLHYFAMLSAALVTSLSYPLVLAMDRLCDRAFHLHPSSFLAIWVFGVFVGVLVQRASLEPRRGAA